MRFKVRFSSQDLELRSRHAAAREEEEAAAAIAIEEHAAAQGEEKAAAAIEKQAAGSSRLTVTPSLSLARCHWLIVTCSL